MNIRKLLPALAVATAGSAQVASAGNILYNFDDGLVPAGASVHGVSSVTGTGGVGDSGVMRINDALNSQQGGFHISEFDGGVPALGFDVSFNARIGDSTCCTAGAAIRPADGFSLSYGAGIVGASVGEEGVVGELVFSFDTWDNNAGVELGGATPGIDVHYGGALIATQSMAEPTEGGRATSTPLITDPATGSDMTLYTGDEFVNVSITMDGGMIDLSYKDVLIFDDLVLPGYTPVAGNWLFGGRTGGANSAHHIDNLSISTTIPEPSGIALLGLGLTGLILRRRR